MAVFRGGGVDVSSGKRGKGEGGGEEGGEVVRQAEQGDIVLPVVGGGAEVADHAFDVDDFAEQGVVDAAFDADAVVEGEAGVEGVALEVGAGVDGDGLAIIASFSSFLGVAVEVADGVGGFEVDDGHVGLHGRAVEGGGGGFAAPFAGLVPGGGADGEALGGGDDAVEGVERRAGDERGLVRDPEVFDRVEGVDVDDSLSAVRNYIQRARGGTCLVP